MQTGFRIFPERASTQAWNLDLLLWYLFGLSVLITLGVAAVIIYSLIKYRRRSEDEIPEQIVGSNRLEAAWTFIPLGLALVAFFWGSRLYLEAASPPDDAMPISVVAKQWMWKFQHPEGQSEINELHVPVGRPVKLTMISQDVIHSLGIPVMAVKQDVLPLRYTTMWFEATIPGQYHLFCDQYCGTQHSGMIGWVYAMPPADYETWLTGVTGGAAAAPPQSPAAAGSQLFQQLGCIACHKPDGTGPGPSLVTVYGSQVQLSDGTTVTADDSYIRESILNPTAKVVKGFQPIMPSFQGRVNETQLLDLIAYLQSLKQQPAGTSPPAPPSNPSGAPTPPIPAGSTPGATPAASPTTPPGGNQSP